MVRTRTVHAALGAAVIFFLGAGCAAVDTVTGNGSSSSPTPASNGVADKAPADVLAAARTALAGAKSVHVKGNGTADGEVYAIDMRIQGRTGGRGTITIHHNPVEILRVGKTAYLKGGAAFWKDFTGDPAAVELLKGKYLKAPADDPDLKDLLAFTDTKELGAQLLTPRGPVTKADRRTVRNVPTAGVTYTAEDGTNSTYVATTGPAYPMYLLNKGKTADVTSVLDFTDYDRPFTVSAPSPDLVIDLDKLN